MIFSLNKPPANIATPQNVEAVVFAERVRALYENLLSGQIITVIVALAIAALAQPTSGTLLTVSWAAAMVAVAIARGVMLYAYRKSPGQAEHARFWHRLFHAGLGLVSLLWVAGSLLFIPELDAGSTFAVLMILVGMTAGAVAILGADRGAYLMYAAALMLPPSLVLGLAPDVHQKLLGILGCAFFVVMLVAANRYYMTLSQALTLAFLNSTLVSDIDTREQRNEKKHNALQRALEASNADRDRLAHTVKMQEAFAGQRAAYASAAAQDMRMALQLIEKQADSLAGRMPDAPEAARILAATQLLLGEMGSMIDACGADAGAAALATLPFRPRALFDTLGVILEPVALQRRCRLKLIVDPALPERVSGDPARFCQIVMTMTLGMTRLAGSGDIKVDVRIISRTSQHVVLRMTVAASAGMARPDVLEELQRLLRQNELRGSEIPDTALTGIQTARRWVEAMKGRISVEIADQHQPYLWAELRLDLA